MNSRDLEALGLPPGDVRGLAVHLIRAAAQGGLSGDEIRRRVGGLAADPGAFEDDPAFGSLARAVREHRERTFRERAEPAPWRQWGEDLEPQAVDQMRQACRLPVAVQGALMPDAHVGYGLPIGGVLATEGAVIPYAVGVDIACRMRLTVLDLPAEALETDGRRLRRALEEQTGFGIGASFARPREHEVMDLDWRVTPVTAKLREKAHSQLGTSGSGNHFVEFGIFTLERADLGAEPGLYVALLSHSGSRGAGSAVAGHYSKLAMDLHPELPAGLRHLAWLDLESGPGQDYWAAMELMGEYAAANHAVIHREILRALGARPVLEVENHHNFAWRETHGGREVIVHRKGATPAGAGVLGVIPGSMASPAFLVRGLGEPASLDSASHGAGRVMSRREALRRFEWKNVRALLEQRGVTLLSAGLDEVPGVYKDIEVVMRQQRDLVEPLARFDPRLVKMAPPGERAED